MEYTGMVTHDSNTDLYGIVIYCDNKECFKRKPQYEKERAIKKLELKMKGLGLDGKALEQFIY